VQEARKRKRKRRPRRYQTRPWLAEKRRLYGHYARLMDELRVEHPQSSFNYLRMEPVMFDELVQRVGPRIEKILPRMRSKCVECCWNAVRIFRKQSECS